MGHFNFYFWAIRVFDYFFVGKIKISFVFKNRVYLHSQILK